MTVLKYLLLIMSLNGSTAEHGGLFETRAECDAWVSWHSPYKRAVCVEVVVNERS